MKYYVGVDLGGTNIAAGVVDENYKLLAKECVSTRAGRSVDEIVQEMVRIAAGISSFITIFRPETIILGGGIADAGEVLFGPINSKIKEYTFAADEIGVPKAVKAALGNDAGILGAALLENYIKIR